jgi:hypothetical protein
MDPGEPQIHENNIWLFILNNHQALFSGDSFKYSVPFVFKIGPEHHSDCIVVFNDHDRAHHVNRTIPT